MEIIKNVGIVITARVKSSRLPNKVLEKINDRETIRILLDHVKHTKLPIVLAIPANSDDDVLEKIAMEEGVHCYRGQDASPIHRITAVADVYGFEHVARVTADDILIDALILNLQIKFHVNGRRDYTYCARILEGAGAEVIRASALEEIIEKHQHDSIEFITYYIKTNKKYNCIEYYPPREYQYGFRCTMDYPEDLVILKVLFSNMVNPGTLDIINFFKRNRFLLSINHLPKITVYVTNHNYSKYLVECLDSIMQQSFNDFELLIYDDCSTDNSAEIILDWYSGLPKPDKKKVKIHRNALNFGLPATCNNALEEARGKYIIRVDADDKLDVYALETMYEHIQDKAACISGYYMCDDKMEVQENIETNEYHPACALLERHSANIIKYRDGLKYFDGLDFWKRFLKSFDTTFINTPLWYYRQHGESKTASNHEERKNVKDDIFNGWE